MRESLLCRLPKRHCVRVSVSQLKDLDIMMNVLKERCWQYFHKLVTRGIYASIKILTNSLQPAQSCLCFFCVCVFFNGNARLSLLVFGSLAWHAHLSVCNTDAHAEVGLFNADKMLETRCVQAGLLHICELPEAVWPGQTHFIKSNDKNTKTKQTKVLEVPLT